MKKLLLIAAALTTMVSCSKTQVIPEQTAQQEISMKAYNQAVVKADGAGPVNAGALPTDSKMKVFGFYANNGTNYDVTPYLNGAVFAYDNSTSTWRGWDENATPQAIKPYYWPTTGKMNFVAVYPTDYPFYTSPGITNSSITNSSGTITVSNVYLGTFAEQKDIMYSVTAFNCPPTDQSALTFAHLLSQVVVNVKSTVASVVKLKSVELDGAEVKGSINIPSASGVPAYTYPSGTSTGDVTYDLSSSYSTTYVNATSFTSVSDRGALVLPSNESNNTKLVVTYSIDDGADIEHSISLSEVWAAGYKYIYNVTIGINEITFTATVNAWTENTVTPAPSI